MSWKRWTEWNRGIRLIHLVINFLIVSWIFLGERSTFSKKLARNVHNIVHAIRKQDICPMSSDSQQWSLIKTNDRQPQKLQQASFHLTLVAITRFFIFMLDMICYRIDYRFASSLDKRVHFTKKEWLFLDICIHSKLYCWLWFWYHGCLVPSFVARDISPFGGGCWTSCHISKKEKSAIAVTQHMSFSLSVFHLFRNWSLFVVSPLDFLSLAMVSFMYYS